MIPENPDPREELTKFKHTGRLNAFTIESNVAGGYFKWGTPLIHTVPGDGRRGLMKLRQIPNPRHAVADVAGRSDRFQQHPDFQHLPG